MHLLWQVWFLQVLLEARMHIMMGSTEPTVQGMGKKGNKHVKLERKGERMLEDIGFSLHYYG